MLKTAKVLNIKSKMIGKMKNTIKGHLLARYQSDNFVLSRYFVTLLCI